MFVRPMLLVLLLFAAAAHAEDDFSAILDVAIEAIEWEFASEWAYTETVWQEGEVWVGRYDPRVDIDDGWKLISVDGREPTSREVREFLHDRKEHDGISDDSISAIVDQDSFELLEETDEFWLLSFIPDANDEAFVDNVDASVKIMKDGPYIEFIEMRNHSDIRPGFGTKLTTFLTRFTFGPAADGGPIVPTGIRIQVAGRALLFIAIDETEAFQYSDFAYAGE